MKKKQKGNEMDCEKCGRKNEAKHCVIGGAPTEETPFTLMFGKGMHCIDCWVLMKTGAV